MSNTSVSTATVSPLTSIQNLLTNYTFIIIFILGNLSNLANIAVFLQKNLRSNACSWYFASVSLGHLLFLYFACLTRIITAWSGFDLTRSSIIFCRLRIYFLTVSLLISRYFLCLISIDRWMVTSTKLVIRQMSSFKFARWFLICGFAFCILFSIHFPFWYNIDNRGCVSNANTFYPLFYTIYNLVITLGPFLIMIIYSLLVLNNLRTIRRRQHPSAVHQTNQATSIGTGQVKRKDIQFIKLSLIQVIIYILFNSLYGYNATYAFITQSIIKTPERAALDSFLSTVGLIISYLYMAVRQLLLKQNNKNLDYDSIFR
mgnify:CR=1 FL=1